MASDLSLALLLCLSSGLWTGTDAGCRIRAADAGDCPPGWSWFEDRCFVFVKDALDWAAAERYCLSVGGNLASFHSTAEYNFIRDLILKKTGAHTTCWVGGNDAAKDGVWMWSDGSKFDFTAWHAGEPNNYGGSESCMDINLRGEDYVNDERCALSLPFVCGKHV
ncbi:ladderlectin [Nothobranchius furzeri]|uniref:ladderlectin n=1 Tax=Nothobranchius furzeri TaxID=105023 RepID=UPI003904C325